MLVDPAVWPWRGQRWSHLVSDESYDELHDFAARRAAVADRDWRSIDPRLVRDDEDDDDDGLAPDDGHGTA